GTRNTVNLDVTRRGEFDTDVLQAEVLGVRDGTDRHQRVGAVDLTTVGGTHAHTTIRGAGDRIHAGVLLQGNTAFREDGFQDVGGVRIIVGQDAVTGGHHGDLDPQLGEGGHKLRTGDTGTDHDEVGGQLVDVIDLTPGEDALPVRLRALEDAWGRT